MDTLKRRGDDDTKTALRAGDKRRLGTLAAIKQREVDGLPGRCSCPADTRQDGQTAQGVARHLHRGEARGPGGQEAFELEIVQSHLPVPLDAARIAALVG